MSIAILIVFLPRIGFAQIVTDTNFVVQLAHPQYSAGKGTTIYIDRAHHNYHTADHRYSPLRRILTADGYNVKECSQRFSSELLKDMHILIIANALDSSNLGRWRLPTPSAFSPEEQNALKGWVERGGSLFLIADHMPFAGAAEELARQFGFGFCNCFALDNRQRALELFTKSKRTLLNSILSNDIDTVVTFTGSAFTIPKQATPVLKLEDYTLLAPRRAWEFDDSTPYTSHRGFYQLAYRPFGRGKIVVAAEAGMFTAQYADGNRVGLNHPTAHQNIRLALNIIHWLDTLSGKQ